MVARWSPIVERDVTAPGFPPGGPILVIAPHPDDESLGCGGLIAAALRHGERVHTVFVTDGGASHRNSREWPRSRLAACRETEASEALRRLGANGLDQSFLRLPDAGMPAAGSADYRAARDKLVAILGDLLPKLVLLPWRRDPHRDHRDSWTLAMDSLSAAGQAPDILEYAIWLDEIGSEEDRPRDGEMERISFDIANEVSTKRHAVRAHLSQLGGLITDDATAFALSEQTIERLTGPQEIYWRPCKSG